MLRSFPKWFGRGRTDYIRRPAQLRLAALEARTVPTQFIVTNTDDSGAGSLRQAVLNANAAVGTDEVIFDPTVFSSPQTITLSSGSIPISTGALTVTGPGPDQLTVSGNNASRIFVVSGPGATISGLTMTSGRPDSSFLGNGGAIYANASPLVVQNSTFLGNDTLEDGGAIYVRDANLTVDECIFKGNHADEFGGAVVVYNSSFSPKTVTIQRSSFFDNTIHYFDGGGLAVEGRLTVTVENSAFFRNTTGFNGVGGAISIGTIELGPYNPANVAIRNSTFSNNRASYYGGALYADDFDTKSVAVQNCTIVDNEAMSAGGGIYAPYTGYLTIETSIIAGNIALNAPNDIRASTFSTAKPISIKSSAIGSPDGFTINDLGGNLAFGTNLKLGLLTNNGGPTLTRLPAPNSPLVNAGTNPALLSTDQRGTGFPRQIGAAVDIGAVESDGLAPIAQPPVFVPVTSAGATTHDIVVEYYGASAINIGSVGVGDVRVTGPNGFDVLADLKSTTGSPNAVTATYVFTPPNGSWDGPDDGDYTVTLNDGQVFDIDSRPVKGGQLGIQRVLISRNLLVTNDADDGPGSLREAFREASRIFLSADSISFDPNFFNVPRTIVLTTGPLTTTDSVILVGPGADLLTLKAGESRAMEFKYSFGRSNKAVIEGVKITGDLALPLSGGISFYGKSLTVRNAVIAGNKSTQTYGGSIFASAEKVTLDSCRVMNNQGIGIYIDAQVATVRNCLVSGNTGGSGLLLHFCEQTLVENTTISANNVDNGSGLLFDAYDSNYGSNYLLTVVNSTISGNKASSNGGGIYSNADVVNLINSTITNNSASTGGGIYLIGEVLSLESMIIAGNQASVGADIKTNAKVNAKNSALGSSTGYTLTDLGGNLPVGIDLKLAPLADNGGLTPTHALLADSPAINKGSNPNNLLYDQRGTGFPRVAGVAADIGAYEFPMAPSIPSPITAADMINEGAVQRSMVTNIKVTFSEAVSFPAGIAAAFELARTGPGLPTGLVNLAFTTSGNTVNVTFDDPIFAPGIAKSLIDGKYTLRLVASKIQGAYGQFDGNVDGTSGDDLVIAFHRLFGDGNGDARVDSTDFTAFRSAFGIASSMFDFHGDGVVSSTDFAEFRKRFGITLQP